MWAMDCPFFTNLLIHPAVQLFSAAIAYIRRLLQLCALLRLVLFTDFAAFVRTAHPAGKITVLITADVFKYTSGMDIVVRLAWNRSVAIEFFYFCVFPNLL